VAGVIAARGADGGIVGVAPAAELADLRACSAGARSGAPAECDSFTLAQAIDYAIEARVDVINLSLAGPQDPLLARLLAAAEAGGIAVVAAAPPAGQVDGFPASVATVIAVGTLEESTAHGVRELHAPGIDVLTTFPGNRYDYGSGSSLASAHVSGVVALMRAMDPHLAPAQLRALLAAHRPLSALAVLEDEAAQIAKR
jgi:subtilisin family serine protease